MTLRDDVKPSDALQDAPRLTDLGNGRRFVADWRHEIRYMPPWKAYVIYDGKRWAMDESGQAVERAKHTVKGIFREAEYAETEDERKALAKHALRSESANKISAMLELARSEPGIPVLADTFDNDPWVLNVANGTVDLRTGTLRAHHPNDMITKLVPIAYDPAATWPLWQAFLLEIMAGKTDVVRFLQKAVGYSLTGLTREQVFFILWGAGSNGKTTFLKVLMSMLGDYARQSPMDTFMQRKGEVIPNDIARLHGVRFVSASEAESQRQLAESLIKSLTGGDTIVARFLHKEFFEFTPRFKIFLGLNSKPRIRGNEHAIWRRIRLIPFTVTIPDERQDKDLESKLAAELPGILAWAIEGCRLWKEDGLKMPETVKESNEEYRIEMDSIGDFLLDRCEVHPDQSVTPGALYGAYLTWAHETGERPISKKMLGTKLAERGFVPGHTKHGRFWRGITLSATPRPADERAPGEDDPDQFSFGENAK